MSRNAAKIRFVAAVVIIAGMTVWELHDFIFKDDGIGYYRSEPKRFLYVVLIAVAGGVLAYFYSRFLSEPVRKLWTTLKRLTIR
jgi:hypothetical protein